MQYCQTLISIHPQCIKCLNVNWFALLEGILPALQNHDWNYGTIGVGLKYSTIIIANEDIVIIANSVLEYLNGIYYHQLMCYD